MALFINSDFEIQENTTESQFNKKLLDLLDSEKLSKSINLESNEVENNLNITSFKKAFSKIKLTYINKVACFILLFFRNFVKSKDEAFINELHKYIKEDKINHFYDLFDKKISEKNNKIFIDKEEKDANESDETKQKSDESNKENEKKDNFGEELELQSKINAKGNNKVEGLENEKIIK